MFLRKKSEDVCDAKKIRCVIHPCSQVELKLFANMTNRKSRGKASVTGPNDDERSLSRQLLACVSTLAIKTELKYKYSFLLSCF
jgi:hypothetical protein